MSSRAADAPAPLTLEIAAILRGARARLQLTTSEVATATGISRAQVGKMLAGDKPISVDHLDLISRTLGLSAPAVLIEASRAVGDQVDDLASSA